MGFSVGNRYSVRGRRTRVDINVTPFVDVMLVLLVVFIVATPVLISTIHVDLPETVSSSVQIQEKPLTVTVSKDKIYIMDIEVKREKMVEKLLAISKENKSARIFVRGDKNISYGNVIDIVNQINRAGFNKVALVTNIKNAK